MGEGCGGSDGLVLAMDGSTRASTAAFLAAAPGHAPGRLDVAGVSGRDPDDWQVLARRTDIDSRRQARVLLRLVDEMLRGMGGTPSDIAAIVVGLGPGTFTGVRIAVATARALALALGVPVLGVSTLSALAAEAASSVDEDEPGRSPDLIVPLVDARRGQVFYGVYRAVGVGKRSYVRTAPFAVCDRGALPALVGGLAGASAVEPQVLIAGEVGEFPKNGQRPGVDLMLRPLEVRAERLLAGQHRLEEPGDSYEGARLASWIESVLARRLAGVRGVYRAGEPGSPEAVKPIYVRSPDADLHITKMRDPWAGVGSDR